MPYYLIFGTDKPDMLEVRTATRPAHREYLRNPGSHRVKLIHGGPTLSNDGESMNGTLLIVEADSLEDVRRFAQDDPYRKANIFARVEIRPWNWTTGRPQ